MLATCAFLATVPIALSNTAPRTEPDPAMARLLHAEASGHSNAFDDLWLLRFDVPNADKSAVVDADVERINALLRTVGSLDGSTLPANATDSSAVGRYPPSPTLPADAPPLCDLDGDDCLARIRAAPDEYRSLLDTQRGLLSRHRALLRHDHFRNRFDAHTLTPIPSMPGLALPVTQAVFDFTDGRTDQALADLCDHTQAWRRIGANSDSLFVTMVATSLVQGNAAAYGQMLNELPADHEEPATCAAAFAPPTAEELSLCTAMTGEPASHQQVADDWQAQQADAGLIESATFEPDTPLNLLRHPLAWHCSDEATERLRSDLPAYAPTQDMMSPECLTNLASCIVADTANPAYDSYALRRQDMAARLRLLDSLRQLRSTCHDTPVATCLERIGSDSAGRTITLGDDGASLHVELYSPRRAPSWQISLPTYLTDLR